ncbi:MAG TPA: sigma factor-like helix-turn-helix DNA-binding protein, partial [Gemmataceae bacterium]|nr:sigma factor-like helix-turn-helix DNA-binding protein [Gemmataceae bacterium]
AAWKEVRGLLDDEVGRLPDALRAPLVLCYFDGLTRDEAAERLGWSRRTLMRRLEQARERLRGRLTRRGVGAVGLGAAVLSPRGLAAPVTSRLAAAAVAAGTGGSVSAGVRALAGGAALRLLHVAAGLSLLLAVGGLGWAALPARPAPEAPAAATGEGRSEPRKDDARGLDADGRPLPAGAVRRLGSRRFRVEGRSDFILPTPDGKYVLIHPQPALSAYAAQGLMLLDADTGLRVRSFEDGRRVPKCQDYAAIRPAAFSPDGKRLYALGWHKSEKVGNGFAQWASLDNPSKRVLLAWDVATGKLLSEWGLPSPGRFGSSLLGVNVSPDGKRLYVYGAVQMTTDADRHIRGVHGLHVLDAATGEKLQTWLGAGMPAGTTAGGKELVTFRRGAPVTAYDVATGKVVRTFKLDGFISSVALSADGKTVAAVGLAGHPDKTTACEVKLWEAGTGRETRRLTAEAKGARNWSARLVFAAGGKTLYLGTGSGRILRWDVASGRALPSWQAHSGIVADLFLRPGKNELVSSGSWDGALRRWDAATGKALASTTAYVGEVAFARTADGKGLVAVDGDGRLDVWDVTAGRVTRTLQTPGRKRHEVLFTPDGKQLLVAAEAGPNGVWDLAAGKQVGTFEPPPKKDPKAEEFYWGTLGFSPDGRRLLASRFGRGTWVWAWPQRKVLWHEAKEVESCAFPDGKTVVSAPWHGEIETRDLESGAVKHRMPGTGTADMAYSPDRRRLVTAHLGGAWRVRDGATGEVLKEVKGFQYAWSVAFSPSGWLLAVSGDNAVRVFDTATWQEVARFDGHEGTVRQTFFGPDDGTLVTASAEDGTALVWSLRPPAGATPDPAKLWADLAGDGPAVRRAVWAAAQHPEVAVKLFRQKWPVPNKPADVERIRKLIAALDGATFDGREAAEAELAKFGRQAEPALRKALAATASPEVKRRAARLLARWVAPATAEYPPDQARELRAVWALELAGTAEAKKLLEAWATAGVGERLCEAADGALRRLRRPPSRGKSGGG